MNRKTNTAIPGASAGAILTRDAVASTRQYHSELVLDRASVNEDTRTVRASLSSEAAVERFFGNEVLEHTTAAVDLGRAVHGLPLLFNHDRDQPLGVVRDLRVADGRLEGELHFSNSSRAREAWEDVREGFLNNTSIGYRVTRWAHDDATDTDTAVRWTLLEASVVTVPADAAVGIGRDANAVTHATRDEGGDVVSFQATRDQARREGELAGQARERERIAGIRSLFAFERFQDPSYRALCDDLVTEGVSVGDAQVRLLAVVGQGAMPIAAPATDSAGAGRSIDVVGGDDALDKYLEAATNVVAVRGQVERDETILREIGTNELRGMTLVELAREYLRLSGGVPKGFTRMQIVGEAFTRDFVVGQGTSAFANVLGNTATKSMMLGWSSAPETWSAWCRTGTLPDFKSADRVALSGTGNLQEVPEGGEYKLVTMSDLKEPIRLLTYGMRVGLSRQAVINDDVGSFTALPREGGAAAARKVGDLAYGVLTANAALNQDATTLFHADHSNLAGSGAAPSVATFNAMQSAMRLQKAPSPDGGTTDGHPINLPAAYAIGPVALEATLSELRNNQYDPAGTAGTLKRNPHQAVEPITDARLDADSATAWYGAINPAFGETVEVAFLDGVAAPFIETMDGWSVDGVQMKVRIDAGVSALDFRGLYKNPGV